MHLPNYIKQSKSEIKCALIYDDNHQYQLPSNKKVGLIKNYFLQPGR